MERRIIERTEVTDDKCRDADQSVGMRRKGRLIVAMPPGSEKSRRISSRINNSK